jgi:hypothetical protein
MLFAMRQVGGEEGNSAGLFLYDLEKSPLSPGDLCAPRELADARVARGPARAFHRPGSAP